MRVLVDPDTGELVEVVDAAALDTTPYDYREAKAAIMRATLDYKAHVRAYREAIGRKAEAERDYRRELATTIPQMKAEHGATNAEALAKGQPNVSEAKERVIIAEGDVYAEVELMRLARDNRVSISQLTAWSRSIDPSTYPE